MGGRTSRIDFAVLGWSVPCSGGNHAWCRAEDNDTESSQRSGDTCQDWIESGNGGQCAYVYKTGCRVGQGTSPAFEAIIERTR